MTDRPLEKVEPFVARWGVSPGGSVEWLVAPNSPFALAKVIDSGTWVVYDGACEDNAVIHRGTSPDLPTAKRDALAKAREVGLCCWFEGEAPMAFEGEWRDGWLVPVGTADRDVVYAAAAGVSDGGGYWDVWRGVSKLDSGKSDSVAAAKTAALESAARHGYRITIREAGPEPAPFVIEAWSYWHHDDAPKVVTPTGVLTRDGHGCWHDYAMGLDAGATHVPNPPHRHPNDPHNIPAAVRECIETHGADVVRRALESM